MTWSRYAACWRARPERVRQGCTRLPEGRRLRRLLLSKSMKVQRNKALRPYNTLGLQACADAFVDVANEHEILAALEWARAHSLPVLPLGGGSNVVLAGDIKALVVRQQSRGIEVLESGADTVTLRVAAGENWHELVRWTLQQGFFGLQNLALIPGTAGAAPIQNIGAYGIELQSVLWQVHAVRIADSARLVLDNVACKFSYRDSIFKHGLSDKLVITAIVLKLSRNPDIDISYPALQQYFNENPATEPTPQAVFDAVVSIRRSRLPDPAIEPNAGSFFKNPVIEHGEAEQLLTKFPALPRYPQADGRVKLPAAWMIEHCGWKGYRCDNLGVHAQHALVLVNYGADSGEQLLHLAGQIAESVYGTFGVQLEMEPRFYGSRT